MKTTKQIKNFPSIKRISIYSAAVAVFCLLSIQVPQARESKRGLTYAEKQFDNLINEVDSEAKLEVQDWMLDF
jgi:hypothetical protein